MNKVRYSPLPQQFADVDAVFDGIRELVASGDFTLGKAVGEFELAFAEKMGMKHASGVGSGTDSLKLPLKALGVGPGDEVITCANTFIATVGAINELGARPVFVDCDDTFCLRAEEIEAAITPRTKAIMPVHLTGEVANMPAIMEIATRHGLPVVEDACQSMMSELDGKKAGSWGIAAGFSMHPLKLINVWGDAGIIVTDDDAMNANLRMLRNHGLANRDEVKILGYNTRLDSLQAIVGSWMLGQIDEIVAGRREAAAFYDRGFADTPELRIPERRQSVLHTYLLYIVFAEERDALLEHCLQSGIEAKIHYPVPLYQQEGLARFGYRAGDFPTTDRHAREMITFPVDSYLSRAEQEHVIGTVRSFYESRRT